MSDGKNTEQVQGFFVKLVTSPNTYIGFGGGLVVMYAVARIFGV